MGAGNTKLEKVLAECGEEERFYGFENFGNTCYVNSVLQALYFCRPFRERVLEYAKSIPKDSDENLLHALADLFDQIASSRKKTGVIPPRRFVQRLKRDNELFRSYMHQDAHEFLNYLLNQIGEILEQEAKAKAGGGGGGGAAAVAASAANGCAASTSGRGSGGGSGSAPSPSSQTPSTWVHDIFRGTLVSETRCLSCENVSCREEVFMDLSLEIEQNSSLTSCLKNFSALERLDRDDKFSCDACCRLQEAQKRLRVRRPPPVLILHLKRFKYVEQLNRMRKLMYRVVFPMELKIRGQPPTASATCSSGGGDGTDGGAAAGASALAAAAASSSQQVDGANVVNETEEEAALYRLYAVVVHVGSGPHHGHYVALVKAHDTWLCFDDDAVESVSEEQVQMTFGSTSEYGGGGSGGMDHGYILFYERCNGSGEYADYSAGLRA